MVMEKEEPPAQRGIGPEILQRMMADEAKLMRQMEEADRLMKETLEREEVRRRTLLWKAVGCLLGSTTTAGLAGIGMAAGWWRGMEWLVGGAVVVGLLSMGEVWRLGRGR